MREGALNREPATRPTHLEANRLLGVSSVS